MEGGGNIYPKLAAEGAGDGEDEEVVVVEVVNGDGEVVCCRC